ncbi:Stk1 family PASTA domain-containing Ser/Thr kinase [Corynebacterium macginleyi]|uniref:non-specific serine/threonine protein kinase n=1 Tax=Corynebacterium macginleyi TaxID=38290 RepID=A0ABS1Y323_9CORY|nr:Stk1 family PASTA domain-containing Ser/Thr kinase [Corynebacterium macginleyi]MBK4174860.1 Stk1 family PASTA domain-containing Ser/Thr kinase [Corynebacterium macginleyi]MBM0242788.1 Stk1 family PASTA domain-containing Ser/Thr kinase [Corynebacterium macginleyi]
MLNDRYRLGGIIGSGGMSEVFTAEDTTLGRQVAVKMLRTEMARDINFRERFYREAQNSGKLNHPNIVAVYDTGESEMDGMTVPYIVMEKVNGPTLRDIIRDDGPLPARETAEILKPVAEALQASHEAGIIHRDIKPANIMLTNTGQVKVMDFGIARALDDSSSAMTQTSAVIGTAQYLSPEQARGKNADARSDVYALGCVMYEVLTGRTPFEGETPFAVAYQHVQEEATPPSELIDDGSLTPTQKVNIDAVVLTAMAKHPADRYQSAWEMAGDLDRLRSGQVTEAARMHVNEDDATTVIPAPATDTAAASHRAPIKSTRPNDEPAEDEGGDWMKWLALVLVALLVAILGYFAWDLWNSNDFRKNRDGRNHAEVAEHNSVIVPEVENRPRSEVVKELEDLGLLVTVNEEANPDIDRNNAIRINPAPGSELQKNASVTLTVSSGKEIIEVPDVTGMDLDEAAEILEEAGLELNSSISERNDAAPIGEVIQQNPAGGTQLSKGSKVRVTVSKGVEKKRVPDVTGLDEQDARSRLEANDFDVNVHEVDSLEPEGTVLSVSNQGAQVEKGQTITIEVSNGILMKAPEIMHKNQGQAENALRQAGWDGVLQVGEPIPTGALVDNNKIGWASVNPGDTIRKDQDVEVRIWKFEASELLPQQ